jgi:hypothetical protein
MNLLTGLKRVFVVAAFTDATLQGWGNLEHHDIDGMAYISLDNGQRGWFSSKEYEYESDMAMEGKRLWTAEEEAELAKVV